MNFESRRHEPHPTTACIDAPTRHVRNTFRGWTGSRRMPGSLDELSFPISRRVWKEKDPARRLKVFTAMSEGQRVSPKYVPIPETLGASVLLSLDLRTVGSSRRGSPVDSLQN